MAQRYDALRLIGGNDMLLTHVEIDELFEGPNPHRSHRFSRIQEIEAWLRDPELKGRYVHRERKIRHNVQENVYFTNEEEVFHVYNQLDVSFPIIGYRHKFSFNDENTAFAFKMMFGSLSVQLGT